MLDLHFPAKLYVLMTLTLVVNDSIKRNLWFTQRTATVTVTCSVLLVAVIFV
ncbi:hypothetical protein HanIR_Chr07g0318581 [Helianthus annuus]|nr:hypothetical protein HanIR_Chr07g0318581 [Helianthus annuus]